MIRPRLLAAAVCCAAFVLVQPGSAQTLPYSLFERYVDALRIQTGIPGLAAAIVRDGRIEWEQGFGRADMERSIATLPDTPFAIGGLTESMGSALLSICADRGMLAINHAITEWVPSFPTPGATVRHVMAHASDDVALGRFRYDPVRYTALTPVAQACSGRPFARQLADDILDRLGMASSVPGMDLSPAGPLPGVFDAASMTRFGAVMARMALPYRFDRGAFARLDVPAPAANSATGVVSTVRDLARFVTAMEQGALLRADSLALAWSPAGFGGAAMPTGLGWFVQQADGFVWQFSREPDGYSGLILRVPERRLTLILLANSNGLVAGINLEQGDVTASPFVRIFQRLFL